MSDRAFITFSWPEIDPENISVSDRVSDLQAVIVYLAGGTTSIHIRDASTAEKLAAAFGKAAALLRAAGPDRFCPKCGSGLPEHNLGCPRGGEW